MSNKLFKISNWYGRLGNNIQQILVALTLRDEYNGYFSMPNHNFIYNFSDRRGFFGRYQVISEDFYDFTNTNFGIDRRVINKKFKVTAEKLIFPKLKIKLDQPFDKDQLVIHLRGGDIFHLGTPHRHHVQNPLSYFEYLVKLFKKVLIIAEPINPNPILFHLLDRFDHIRCLYGDLHFHYSCLLRARNLASSGAGSFCMSAALCSPFLENFYCSDRYIDHSLNPEMLEAHLNVHMIKLNGWLNVGEWSYGDEYLDLMMNYKLY